MKYDILNDKREVISCTDDYEKVWGLGFWWQIPGAWGLRDNEKCGRIRLLRSHQVSTPWGMADSTILYSEGITEYGTPSHGGFRLNEKRHDDMPPALKAFNSWAGGSSGFWWYEEDCDWAIVALAFPQHFTAEEQGHAHRTVRNWHPEVYEAHFKLTLAPGESNKRDERAWMARHGNSMLVLAAWGDWHEKVPKGFVGVLAGRGGRTPNGQYPAETAYYLVPGPEYSQRGKGDQHRFDFVIDENRHQRVEVIN